MKLNPNTVIKKGFVVDIYSWENDADDYKHTITTSLTKAQADFLINIARAFISRNGSRINRSARGFGNNEITPEVVAFLKEQIASLGDEKDSIMERFDLDGYEEFGDYEWLDFLHDYVLGSPEQYDYDFCRVVETIELKELTEDFVVPDFNPPFKSISSETL